MKKYLIISFLISVLISEFSFGAETCDTVYSQDIVDFPPMYKDDELDLHKYFWKELKLVNECNQIDSILISNLYMEFTISNSGEVINVDFTYTEASLLCQEEIRKKLLTMTGWKPAKKDGEFVCCTYLIPLKISWR